jgi:anti-anti-sigma regulatory factor
VCRRVSTEYIAATTCVTDGTQGMEMIAAWLKIDEESFVEALQETRERLANVGAEVALDFCSVRRIDANAIRTLEGLAGAADDRGAKVVLRGVDVAVYRVLKLVKLAARFSFVN